MGRYDGIVLYSDYDGTLADPDNRIAQENLDAIAAFQEHGGRFSLATGKSLFDLREMPFSVNAPVILTNGADVWDPGTRSFLRRRLISEDEYGILGEIFDGIPEVGLNARNAEGDVLCFRANFDVVDPEEASWFTGVIPLGDRTGFGPGINEVTAYGSDADLMAARRAVARHPGLSCSISYPGFLSIVPAGVDKGSGLSCVMDSEVVPGSPIYLVVGDGENDLGLFSRADVAFAMGNALDDVKAAADVILEDNAAPCIPQIVEYIDDMLLDLGRA